MKISDLITEQLKDQEFAEAYQKEGKRLQQMIDSKARPKRS